MKIIRQPEIVEAYHYDMNKEKNGETYIRVTVTPKEIEEPDFPSEQNSLLALRVEFLIVFNEFTLSGAIAQIAQIIGKKVTAAEDCNKEELEELARPLFSMIERLTYEVTEIALDQPGIQLNFETE